MKEAYIFVTKMLQIYNKGICWEMIKMIKIINSLKNSYKRKIMIFVVISLFMAFAFNEITNKDSYIIYYENQPVGITKVRPQVVYKAYGDAKAKFYSEGKNISDDEIYLEKTGKKYGNVKYIGENEISETIYSRLDDKEPILVGKSTQLFPGFCTAGEKEGDRQTMRQSPGRDRRPRVPSCHSAPAASTC